MHKNMLNNLLGAVFVTAFLAACSGDGGNTDTGAAETPDAGSADQAVMQDAAMDSDSGDADAGSSTQDAATDNDATAAPDCSACNGPVCLTTISGHIAYEDGSPYQGPAAICIGACRNTSTNAQGDFHYALSECMAYDPGGEAIVLTLLDTGDAQWSQYSAAYRPTQQDVSDQGAGDFDLDLGTHTYYAVSGPGFAYSAASGASVSQDGLSFEVPAADLGANDLSIRLRRIDLSQSVPPFVPADMQLDALYYLSPYFSSSAAGLQLRFDAASLGWSAGDTGAVYMLGGFSNFHFLNCHGEDAGDGDFVDCGSASVQDGQIVSSGLPLLGWVGLVKNP